MTINGSGEAVLAQAPEDAKLDYMTRVYKMSHAELFAELMRVHTEANRLIGQMQQRIDELEGQGE